MSILNIIPTCEDPMSIYSLCAVAILVIGGLAAFTLYSRWTSKEFRAVYKKVDTIEGCISRHDDYIDTTNDVINKIHIDLAVQKNSMTDLKNDIAEIKTDIKILLRKP